MSETKRTVLIVDDEKPIVAQIFSYLKGRYSYEPIATANPAIVEKVLETYQVDLIIADLRMPNISGFDIIKMVRAKGLQIPFIIITAYLKTEFPKLKEVGLSEADVVEKPFAPETLETKISAKLKIDSAARGGKPQVFVDNNTHVLIVDDEPEIIDILAESLREEDYTVDTFKNGRETLEHFKDHGSEYHVAIIDIAIPGLSGDQLILELRKVNPKLEIIPISARYPESVKERLKSVGFDPEKLMTKPFSLVKLLDQIRAYAVKAGVYIAH